MQRGKVGIDWDLDQDRWWRGERQGSANFRGLAKPAIVFAVVLSLMGIVGAWRHQAFSGAREPSEALAARQEEPSQLHPDSHVVLEQGLDQPSQPLKPLRIRGHIAAGETLSDTLRRRGISPGEIHRLAQALREEINPRSIQPGDAFVLQQGEQEGKVQSFELVRGAGGAYQLPVRYRVSRQETAAQAVFSVVRVEAPVTVRQVGLSGRLDRGAPSLYSAVLGAGGDATLVDQLAVGVFGWRMNFHRDARRGDRFKVIAEKRSTHSPCWELGNGDDGLCESFMGYGRVLAAEYINRKKIHRGFSYQSEDGKIVGIFDEDGRSLETTFLKSPLSIARITSRYGMRFHPVRKRYKPHNGVDFGAVEGTPFWTVADGVVERVGFNHRANGNFVEISHPGGVLTQYLHASRIAKGIRPGVRVKQRQVIGYVGKTGWATSAHLHFGMKRLTAKTRRGKTVYIHGYVDPLRQRFPAGKPVPEAYREEYQRTIAPLIQRLETMSVSTREQPLFANEAVESL
ncbi:MAG: M23 family metallopeptidase [Myxococcota bacterium]